MGDEHTTDRDREGGDAGPAAALGDPRSTPATELGDPRSTLTAEQAPDAFRTRVRGGDFAGAIGVLNQYPAAYAAVRTRIRGRFLDLVRGARPHDDFERADLDDLFPLMPVEYREGLFEARFGVEVRGRFSPDELMAVHEAARQLPPGHLTIESLDEVARTNAVPAGSAGTYDESTDRVNMGPMGTQGTREERANAYSDTFRHEMGHAVDSQLGSVQSFRLSSQSWLEYATADAWIAAAGGYGSLPQNQRTPFRNAVDAYARQAVGSVATPSRFDGFFRTALTAAGFDETRANAAIEHLTTGMGSNQLVQVMLWAHFGDGLRPANGRFFGIRTYYPKFHSVSSQVKTMLTGWSRTTQASFASLEWFAELYADRYGQETPAFTIAVPGWVESFFAANIDNLGTQRAVAGAGGGGPRASG